ncbi:MAG: TonB-dependent receptor, partial [Bacteroidota bacterium]|nr:TonB-dependent receptor [Bacteroidota bacterium]MDX5430435.1 TonB-dependent receptor [Bacteroidota bacterium]MDX5469194.1 TonB-dependent receptor [Bacteroidota bacterium]
SAGFKYKNSLHRIQSSYFWEKLTNKTEPVFTPYAIYARDSYFYTQRLSQSLFSDFRLNQNTTINTIFSYSSFQRVKASYRKDLVNLVEVPINEPDAQDTANFSLWLFRGIYTHRINPKFSLQTGYDINLERGSGERLENNEQSIQDYALFASGEWQVHSRLLLKPGMRFIYNSRYGAPWVPAMNLKFDVFTWWQIRASYARGFRAPSLKELSLYFVDVNHNIQGNEDLKAEQSNNFNATMTFTGRAMGWQVKLEPSAFHNTLMDMINLAVVDQQQQLYRYVNIDRFKTKGFAINAEARRDGVSAALGYALTGRYNELAKNNFIYSPEFRVNLSYLVPKLNVDVSVFYKYTGTTPGFAMEQNQVVQTKIESYQTMDLTASRTFWKRRVNLVCGAKNLFNVTNINFTGTSTGGVHSGGGGSMPINQGRTYFVSLRFNFIQMKG